MNARTKRRLAIGGGVVGVLLLMFASCGVGGVINAGKPIEREVKVEKVVPGPTVTKTARPAPTVTRTATPPPATTTKTVTLPPAPAVTKTSSAAPAPKTEPQKSPGGSGTTSQQNALDSAKSYLEYTSFSKSGLIKQLEFEDFSTADAQYVVDNLDVDYNAQAAKSAKSYLDYTSFSRQGLIDQLVFEGYTVEQATSGTNAAGL